MPSNSGRHVLITGASRGIGRSLALRLAEHGFQVLAGIRNPVDGARLRAVAGDRVLPVPLDVTQPESIRSASQVVARETGDQGLYALINNAGVATFGPLEQQPLEAFERIFRVNVFGAVALTQAMLPLLRLGKGRLVNISSGNGVLSMPFGAAYCGSKFALEAISDALRTELRPWGIQVVVVQPGAMATDIRVQGVQAWLDNQSRLEPGAASLYAEAMGCVGTAIQGMEPGAGPLSEVGEVVLQALTEAVPRSRYVAGPGMEQLAALRALPDQERDQVLAGMLGLTAKA